jgi:predicted GIY-YIG superfamily endonuclease
MKKWSKNKVLNLAKKSKSYTAFRTNYEGAYCHARINGFINEVKKILEPMTKPNGYWTKKNCIKHSKECNSRIEFRKKYRTAYEKTKINKWDKEVFKHFIDPRAGRVAHNFKWTKKLIRETAKKYTRRTDFERGAPGAYKIALENKYLDDICSHMETVGHKYKRAAYAIEFSDKTVYVGIAFDYKERKRSHINKKSHNKHVEAKKQILKFKWVEFGKWLSVDKAQIEELRIINQYIKKGWKVLNIAKTGLGSSSLGSNQLRFTEKEIYRVAKLCKTASEMKKRFPGAYRRACKLGILNKIQSHMVRRYKPSGYWKIKSNCLAAARLCVKRSHYKERFPNAYVWALKEGWLEEFFPKAT